jgi:predicted MPP superfamily phosphohydrolase
MVLAVLHLSDMHLAGDRSSHLHGRVPQIVAALRSAYPLIDQCLVVVSGDIAYSGRAEEYREALEFVSRLRVDLQVYFPGVQVLAVPGNHDCDFTHQSDLRKPILGSIQSGMDDPDEKGKTLRELLDVQINFFAFQSQLTDKAPTLVEPWIVRDDLLELGTERIRIVGLNTAFMSQIPEQRGTLYFPLNIASRYFEARAEASLVISVLHHPYSWLEGDNADRLKRLIEARTDVVLTGHEHIQDAYTKELMSGQRLEYVQGAVLESKDSPTSGFNVVLCDLENKTQKIVEFRWVDDRYTASVERAWKPFVRNDTLRRRFDKNSEFVKYLEAVGTGFIHPRRLDLRLDDIFVYPDLQRISLDKGASRKDVSLLVPSSDVPAFIHRTQHLLVIGSDHSGRSALSRKIFRDLDGKGFVPLLLRGKELKAKTVDGFLRAVDVAYADQYSPSSLEAFKQLDPGKKVLILDDWHHTKFGRTTKKQIVDAATRMFGKVVVVASLSGALR